MNTVNLRSGLTSLRKKKENMLTIRMSEESERFAECHVLAQQSLSSRDAA